jgi:hypothetical protein
MNPQNMKDRNISVYQNRPIRNPFTVMDVPNSDDQEVLEFAASAALAGNLGG